MSGSNTVFKTEKNQIKSTAGNSTQKIDSSKECRLGSEMGISSGNMYTIMSWNLMKQATKPRSVFATHYVSSPMTVASKGFVYYQIHMEVRRKRYYDYALLA